MAVLLKSYNFSFTARSKIKRNKMNPQLSKTNSLFPRSIKSWKDSTQEYKTLESNGLSTNFENKAWSIKKDFDKLIFARFFINQFIAYKHYMEKYHWFFTLTYFLQSGQNFFIFSHCLIHVAWWTCWHSSKIILS